MKISLEGLSLIKKFEGCKLEAYYCSGGVLTIGYGHTGKVKETDVITQDEADRLLKGDILKFVSASVFWLIYILAASHAKFGLTPAFFSTSLHEAPLPATISIVFASEAPFPPSPPSNVWGLSEPNTMPAFLFFV